MVTIKQIKSANTISDLAELNIGRLSYDIGGRGGHVAFTSRDVSEAFGIRYEQLTSKVGAYTNYLGGGIRSSVMQSEFHRIKDKRKQRLVEELTLACKRAYLNAEDEMHLNDEEYEDGDINWDAKATNINKVGVDKFDLIATANKVKAVLSGA
jgi:hypothetical protein